jgi:hypothetical protein
VVVVAVCERGVDERASGRALKRSANRTDARRAGVDAVFPVAGILTISLIFSQRIVPFAEIMVILALTFLVRYAMLVWRPR